jgi:hypothetical protein
MKLFNSNLSNLFSLSYRKDVSFHGMTEAAVEKMAGVTPRPAGRTLRWRRCSCCLANGLLQKHCVPGFNGSLSPGKISWLFDIEDISFYSYYFSQQSFF